jgi:hypothetical protein
MLGAAAIGSVAGNAILAQPSSAAGVNLYVSTTGSDGGGNNCQTAGSPCATLAYALTQAVASDTILIAPGTYTIAGGASNTVTAALTGLTIESNGGNASNTIINATGAANGIVVQANNVTVQDLTVENANLEGILVEPPPATWPATPSSPAANVTGAVIANNVVTKNDASYNTSSPGFTACPSSPTDTDDCGEAVHLLGATNSTVSGNTVSNNVGGILISDGGLPTQHGGPTSVGPAAHNTIAFNVVTNNSFDCGITLPGHDPRAVSTSGATTGQDQPTLAGVYSNTIESNVSDNNGGAGIGVFAPYPGTASYKNTIMNNVATGNGNAGVTLHSHAPLQDLSGNVITGNSLSNDGIGAGPMGGPGDTDALVTVSQGVLVLAAAAPVTGTVITNNSISNVFYGIWQSTAASSSTISGNSITVTPGGTAIFTVPAAGKGYSMVGNDGGVFSFGNAGFYGSEGGKKLNQPVVSMASTPDGGGYWLVAKDGGIFNFGDAGFYGSLPGLKVSVSDIVGIAPTADGGGYWLVAKDGGVFAFGDAGFFGSLPGLKVSVSNVVGIAPTADGAGYWMVANDGGVFAFGDAKFIGSLPGLKVKVSNVVGIAPTSDGGGYWMVGSDGGTFNFGDAGFFGSLPGLKIKVSNILGIVPTP